MDRLTITAKIWLSIGVYVLGFILTTILGQVQSRITEGALHSASNALFPAAQHTQEAGFAFQRMVKGFSDAVMTQDASAVERASQDGIEVVRGLRAVATIEGLSADRVREASALASSIDSFIGDSRRTYGSALGNAAGLTADTQAQMRELAARTDTINAALQSAKEHSTSDLKEQLGAVARRSSSQRWLALFLFMGTLVVAGAIVHLTIRRSVSDVLKQAVRELTAMASATAGAASEIASAAQTLAQGANEQGASLEEVSTSGEEISCMTRKNADHSRDAADKVNLTARRIDEANARLSEMMDSMNEIDASGDKVSKIIRTIDEIAFQTNILALNAAVEAARAGEAGMGFAVVADEVRNLAQRCAEAARNTTTLIEESISRTKVGKDRLDQVAGTIRSVTTASTDVKQLVDEISTASEEQARGMKQVSAALARMGGVTQRNAAGAEESAAAAEELSSQSRAMEGIIARLAAMVE